MAFNPALASYIDKLIKERGSYTTRIVELRTYTEGEQEITLTANQLELLTGNKDGEFDFNYNVCDLILETVADRVRVRGFKIEIPAMDGESEDAVGQMSDKLTDEVRSWWDANEMPAKVEDTIYSALRDGDCGLITSWDGEQMRPRWTRNEAYDGDNGVLFDYLDGSGDNDKPYRAQKRWIMARTKKGKVERQNFYYDDRVEKFVRGPFDSRSDTPTDFGWRPYDGDGDPIMTMTTPDGDEYEAAVMFWTDEKIDAGDSFVLGPNGRPLGLAIEHVKALSDGGTHGQSVLKNIVPGLQNALNLVYISFLAASLTGGFDLKWASGFDSNRDTITVGPGSLLTAVNPDARFGAITAMNILQLRDAKDSVLRDIATLARIPLSYLVRGAQVAAEGTLQQQEAPLLALATSLQAEMGRHVANVIKMGIRLAIMSGALRLALGVDLDIDAVEEFDVKVDFHDPQTRVQSELMDVARLAKDLGIPDAEVWRLTQLFSDEQIAKMLGDENARRDQMMAMIAQFALMNQNPTAFNAANGSGAGQPVGRPDENGNGASAADLLTLGMNRGGI